MSKLIWPTKLERLHKRFVTMAEKHSGLRCVLLEGAAKDKLKDIPRGSETDIVGRSRSVSYGKDKFEQSRSRRHYFVGSKAVVEQFNDMSADAGAALAELPPDLLTGMPFETWGATSQTNRWVWCVFDLAWQRLPNSRLRAYKYFWGHEHAGIGVFPHDTKRMRELIDEFDDVPESLFCLAKNLPEYFFSEINDVFLASVYAVIILLGQVPIEVADGNPSLVHRNIQFGRGPVWMTDLAWQVHHLVRNPTVMERWRAMIRGWVTDHESELQEADEWRSRREAHEAWILADDRLRNKDAGPPARRWVFECLTRQDEDLSNVSPEPSFHVEVGWFPPNLRSACEPEPKLPLPPNDRVLGLPEKYAILGVVHDSCCASVEPIDPWWPHTTLAECASLDEYKRALAYTILARHYLPKLSEEDHRRPIEAFVAEVKVDLDRHGLLPSETIARTWTDECIERTREPTDLIVASVAVQEFAVTRVTLYRAVANGKLKSYRAPGAAANSLHLYSRADLAKLYTKRGT